MKPAVRISIAAAILIAAVVALIAGLPRWLATPDVTFGGRPVEAWVAELKSGNPGASNTAVAMTTNVIVPQLLDTVHRETHDRRLKLMLVEALDSLPGIHVDFVPADGRRALALEDLAKLGPAGESATPELVRLLDENDERLIGHAATALAAVRCKPAIAVPALLHALLRPDGHGRPEAVDALAEYGTNARVAIPQLLNLLDDYGSKEIRVAVPRALKAIDPERFAKLPGR